MSIVVRNSIPIIPEPASIRYRETVRASSLGHFITTVGHLEGWKFRRALHAQVTHDATIIGGGSSIFQNQPLAGSVSHWFSWQSQRRAQHVAIIIGYQAYAASGDPTIQAILYDRSGAPAVIDAGVEWSVSGGHLREGTIRQNGNPLVTYPIRYATTSARLLSPAVIAAAAPGFTAPRVLTIPSASAGNRLTVELRVDSVRPHTVTIFERPEVTVE